LRFHKSEIVIGLLNPSIVILLNQEKVILEGKEALLSGLGF
jgi:hypothetical protein